MNAHTSRLLFLLSSTLPDSVTAQALFPCASDDLEVAEAALSSAQEMLQFAVDGYDDDGIRFGINAQKWLGARNSEEAQGIRDALERALVFSEDMQFLCGVDSSFDAIAQVYQDTPVPFIQLGRAFFDLSNSGFETQGGVLVHELMHGLLVLGATSSISEQVYGGESYREEAIDLAVDDPEAAMLNADNYRIFVEAFFFDLD